MQINVGSPERIIRLVLGTLFLILGIFAGFGPFWGWVLGIVGVVLLATGLFRFCPAWWLLGFNTCRMRK